MKYLKLFENYNQERKIDKILDIISKFGIDYLSKTEREYLDKYSSNNKISDELEKKMDIEEGYIFNSIHLVGLKFEFYDIEEQDDYIEIKGTVIYPNLPNMFGSIMIDLKGEYLGYEFNEQVEVSDGFFEAGIDLEESLGDKYGNQIDDFFKNDVIPYIDIT